jgi:hypothetical protein
MSTITLADVRAARAAKLDAWDHFAAPYGMQAAERAGWADAYDAAVDAYAATRRAWAERYLDARVARCLAEGGHRDFWVDLSHAGPDGGNDGGYCCRCGWSFDVTLY